MLKRMLTVIMVSCFLPVMAHAATWSLTTAAKTAGGTIQVADGAARTYLQGNLVTTYQVPGSVDVTVAANAGYEVSKVVINGITTSYPTQPVFTMTGSTTDSQSIAVSFAIKKYNVSSSVAGNVGGTVIPTLITGITPDAPLTAAKTVTFIPASAAFTVSSITGIPVIAAPAIAAIQSPAAPPAGQTVTVTFPVGFAFTSNVVLVGTFESPYPVANAGTPQNSLAGTTVLLDGSGSQASGIGIASYLWKQTYGPSVTLTNANTAQASFIPSVGGTYGFSLQLMPGASTAATTVTVYDSIPGFARDQCYNCHFASGVGVASNVFGNWSSSGHKAKGVVCSRCHVVPGASAHPGRLISGSVSETNFNYTASSDGGNFCVSCHSPTIVTDFAASKHAIRAGAASCSFCHVNGVHNPAASCADCHKADNSYGLVWPPAGFTFHSTFTDAKVCKACHSLHNPKTFSFDVQCTQ